MAGKQEAFNAEENRVLHERLRKLYEESGLTQRELGEVLGIEQQNVGTKLRKTNPSGFSRAAANKLAQHLGYRDAEDLLLDAGVLAEMKEPPPARVGVGASWERRDRAVALARTLRYDEVAIQAVIARHTDDDARHWPMKRWLYRFSVEELERAADPPLVKQTVAPTSATVQKRKRKAG